MTFQSVTLIGNAPMPPIPPPAPMIPLSRCDACFALLQPSDQIPHERWHQSLTDEREAVVATLESIETTVIDVYQDVQKLKEASAP